MEVNDSSFVGNNYPLLSGNAKKRFLEVSGVLIRTCISVLLSRRVHGITHLMLDIGHGLHENVVHVLVKPVRSIVHTLLYLDVDVTGL